MQRLAHDQLAATLKNFNAKAGGAVVLDAQTGEILAMTSLPDYDANYYQEYPATSLRNFAVSETMELGSVMKPFIIAKALDDGKIGRNSAFNTRPYEISGKTIRDTHDYPSLTTQGILQNRLTWAPVALRRCMTTKVCIIILPMWVLGIKQVRA